MDRTIRLLRVATLFLLIVGLALAVVGLQGCYGELYTRPGIRVEYEGGWSAFGTLLYSGNRVVLWYQEGQGQDLREPADPAVVAMDMTLYRQTGSGAMGFAIVETDYRTDNGYFTGSHTVATGTAVLESARLDQDTIRLQHEWGAKAWSATFGGR